MKRILLYAAATLAALFLAASCNPLEENLFSESDLYGKWQSGTLFYTYASDHTGNTWDTADDVTEEEGMKFTWELVQSELTHIYVTQLDASSVTGQVATKASVPKVYKVTTLTADKLVYEDEYGTTYSFSKVR